MTSMHDATEGGVLGGLYELSSACGLPVMVEQGEDPRLDGGCGGMRVVRVRPPHDA